MIRRTLALIFIVALVVLRCPETALGQTWTRTSAPNYEYEAVACSADGTKLIAANNQDTVYLSANSGQTWSPISLSNQAWHCVASSADGSHLFAGAQAGLFTSTNSGVTWTTNNVPAGNYNGIACSADGMKVAAVSYFGPLLYSTNSGATFTSNAVPGGYFGSIVSSADGTKLAGMYPSHFTSPESDGSHSPIYRSVDSGVTWTQTGAPATGWIQLACSADGTILAAVDSPGFSISKNSGLTWVTNLGPSAAGSVACSADGTRFLIAQSAQFQDAGIFTSLDSGNTWATNNVPNAAWTGVAMSADGSFLVASAFAGSNGGIYTAQIPAQPSLNVGTVGTNLLLSWPLPSAGFVLQQSSMLNSTNWVNVTNPVAASGYYNQVTLPSSSGNTYYRLANP